MLPQYASVVERKLLVGQVVNVIAFATQPDHPRDVVHTAVAVPEAVDVLGLNDPHVGVTRLAQPGNPPFDEFRIGVDQWRIFDLDRHHEIRLQGNQKISRRLARSRSLGFQRVPEMGLVEHALQGRKLVGVADRRNNRRNIEIPDIGTGHAVSSVVEVVVAFAVSSNSASRRGSSKVMPSTPREIIRLARLSSRPTPHARTTIPRLWKYLTIASVTCPAGGATRLACNCRTLPATYHIHQRQSRNQAIQVVVTPGANRRIDLRTRR